MTDNFIQLGKSKTLKLGIKDETGKPTGEFLEFDLEDIELPLKYQEMIEMDKKNKNQLQNKMRIISKREDHKGKKLLSANEEAQMKALNDFFQEEVKVYNIFLGKNGVQKLLNGRKLGWTSLQDIDEIIEKQILPYLDVKMKNIIESKYSDVLKKNKGVLE